MVAVSLYQSISKIHKVVAIVLAIVLIQSNSQQLDTF